MTSLSRKTVWEREEVLFLLPEFTLIPLFSVPFMNHQLFLLRQKPAGRESSPWETLCTMCVYLILPDATGHKVMSWWVFAICRRLRVLVERKCVKWSFLLSRSFAGRAVEGGGIYDSPSSWPLLPPSGTVLPALGSEAGRCVCVDVHVCTAVCVRVCVSVCMCTKRSGKEWWRGNEAFCGPGNWSTRALFSQTSLCMHIHTAQVWVCFLLERGLFQNTSGCVCQLE